MELVRRKPGNDPIELETLFRRVYVHYTHLPDNDPKGVDVAGLRAFGTNKPEALRVDQFRGSTVEEPIYVCPQHDRWN